MKKSLILTFISLLILIGDSVTNPANDTLAKTKVPDETLQTLLPTLDSTLTPSVNVTQFGTKGDGITDDTNAIQTALDYAYNNGISLVTIPDGTYLIDAVKSLKVNSNTTIEMSPNCIILVKPNSKTTYAAFDISSKQNITLKGGQIIGDRTQHLNKKGEWGMGVRLMQSQNITLENIKISNCWGDGIYLGATSTTYNENVTIRNVNLVNNRRQGISIISAKHVLITDSIISNTNGTAPQYAIDLEPNSPTQYLDDITISNVTTNNNKGGGILIYSQINTPGSITISNHTSQNDNICFFLKGNSPYVSITNTSGKRTGSAQLAISPDSIFKDIHTDNYILI